MGKKKTPEPPTPTEPKTLTEKQFFNALERFRKQCYGTYCPDCKYKGKYHSIISCFELFMKEVYQS